MFALKPSSYFHIHAVMRLFSTQRKLCFRVVHTPDIIFFRKLEKNGINYRQSGSMFTKKKVHILGFYVRV
jgi:hypothetical protein